MLVRILSVILFFENLFFASGASKPRCAVVLFVNESSLNDNNDFSKYLENIQGLSVDKTSVFFSEDPDSFVVKHGKFIDAPGLFALESEKFPGMYLRRANHTIVLQHEHSSDSFKNDATFLMDHPERNASYTSLKLFSHRSWELFSEPDSKGPLLFDIPERNTTHRRDFDLLVIAQPCTDVVVNQDEEKESSKAKSDPNLDDDSGSGSGSGSDDIPLVVTKTPSVPHDPTLAQQTDAKYLTAVTNKGKLSSISNEYSFENFKVPDFIMHSLVEEDKNAGDGVEFPKPEVKPSASIVQDDHEEQQQKIEHQTKLPTAKQKISELSSLINDDEADDIGDTLKDLQYGSKGCKLIVAEDSVDEAATVKDTVAHPAKKECRDEFPDSCQEMAKKGHCLAFKSLMSSVCRKSCNLCASLVDTGFTSCTKSCGGGRQMRMIKIHRREYLQTRRCNTRPCPIDGGYSEYGHFTECSVTCGHGVKYRRRTCTNPRPQFSGKSCKRLGPSIESRHCYAGPCPHSVSHHDKDEHHGKEKNAEKGPEHRKMDLHLDGQHSDKVHEHSVLLKGKKVAKLRCTPRKGQLRSIIQEAATKRFIIHGSSKKTSLKSKKSEIEEGKVLYNHEGLPVDTSNTIVKAFKSPYKIILARKGAHNMKMVEECIEADEDTVNEDHELGKHQKSKQVYTRPGEKSTEDFDEYKYETGNVVTPEITTNFDDANHESDYSTPSGKLFDEPKDLDSFLNRMNAIKPRLDEQLTDEQDLESSSKLESASPVEGLTFNGEGGDHEGDMDTTAARAGFSVTTAPDSSPQQMRGDNDDSNGNRNSDGFEVETVPDG